MKLYLHLYDKNTPENLETGLFTFKKAEGTLQDLFREIQDTLPRERTLKAISTAYKGAPFSNFLLNADFFFDENSDIYAEVETKESTKMAIEEIPQIFFEPINKYVFYETDDQLGVKVTFELEGIGAHPKDKIEARFLDRSLEIKIIDFKSKNYVFAVPKLQNKIIPEQSKFGTNKNKVIITLKKVKKEDNWNTLFRTKAIGDDE